MKIAKLKELLSHYSDNTDVFIYDKGSDKYLSIESIIVCLESEKVSDISLQINSNE